MTEYIEREALLNDFRESYEGMKRIYDTLHYDNERQICSAQIGTWIECILRVKEAPAADVVEVVRVPVKGYEGYYEVDRFGRVFSVDRVIEVNDNGRQYAKPLSGRQMKQSMHDKGYKTVSLTRDGKTKTIFVHRIVAEAFLDNPDGLPMVNHKDEDKTNNFVENLEWCSASYNRTYGKAVEKHAKTLRGRKHTEEHKTKISKSMKEYRTKERIENGYCYNGRGERKCNEAD